MAVFGAIGAAPIRAQCADGSPPPCAAVAVSSAARRTNPPLDPRTWIVLPFENVTRAPDLDWLRDGSVNLLYLDLSRWTDIRVIDDERVSDLLRELASVRGQPLSLADGLATARRAGARRLVMGDVLKSGSRVAVVAKVFDVADGTRVRSVREEVTSPDSMFALFPKLARGILDVAPPAGANVGALGTSSTDAYQEYLAGIKALNGFDLAIANRHFLRAVELDSTFALAHYKLALSLLWGSGTDPRGRLHAERALQLSSALPSRERTLIKAFAYFPRGDMGAMCATVAPLVRADSSDVDALAQMADCLYHDRVIIPVPGDTTKLQFRGSWNESFRLFRRVLQLDPTYHLAYQHVVDGNLIELRTGSVVSASESPGTAAQSRRAFLNRDGDSLLMIPTTIVANTPAWDSAYAELGRSRARVRNVQIARATAEEWLAAAPSEPRAHRSAARVYTVLGQLPKALYHMDRGRGNLGGTDSVRAPFERFDVTYRLFDFAGTVRWLDSVRIHSPAYFEGAPFVWGLTGNLIAFDSATAASAAAGTSPQVIRYRQLLYRVALGLPSDSAVILETQLPGPAPAVTRARRTLMFALRSPRAAWPVFDSVPTDLRLRPAAALARNDTGALRRAARSLDSASRAAIEGLVPERGFSLVAADAYLALGDSVAAQKTIRWALDTVVAFTTPLFVPVEPGINFAFMVPRMILLRADLAAARGSPDEARIWYRRLLDLWVHADAEFQPLIERARRGYAAAGGK